MKQIVYLKLDAKHQKYEAELGSARAAFATVYPKNEMSVNLSADGAAAWVKTVKGHDVDEEVVLDSAAPHDSARVAAEVSSEAWIGSEAYQALRSRARGPR